jgi:shikimate dehydrogenase
MSKIYGIVGNPLSDHLTPPLMNAALEHSKMGIEFKKFELDLQDPESLANFCYETDLNEIGGFGVAAPFKQAIMDYMDYYDPLAKIMGSVNTVVNEKSQLIGHNTESLGALQALLEKTKIPGKKILVLGAGPLGRGLAYSLKSFGADVFAFDRVLERAEQLAKDFDVVALEFRDIGNEEFDILINATPVGSGSDRKASLLSSDQIPSHSLVMDTVLHPIRTQLLREAEKAGAQTISGDRMLLNSALRQFELWFGMEAPKEAMEEALLEELGKMGI